MKRHTEPGNPRKQSEQIAAKPCGIERGTQTWVVCCIWLQRVPLLGSAIPDKSGLISPGRVTSLFE